LLTKKKFKIIPFPLQNPRQSFSDSRQHWPIVSFKCDPKHSPKQSKSESIPPQIPQESLVELKTCTKGQPKLFGPQY